MLVSFVVRLAPAALVSGRLTGEVEHVLTGSRATFRNAVELTAWCAARAAAGTPSVTYQVADQIDLTAGDGVLDPDPA